MQLTVSTDIEAPATTVWAIITDIDGSAEVLSGVERIERVDALDGFGVGVRWRETRTMFGKESTETMAVTAVEPGVSYTVGSQHGSTTYTSVLQVEDRGDGRSQLTMSFGARSTGVVTRLLGATMGRLMVGATRKMLERDLADIAAAAEARTTS